MMIKTHLVRIGLFGHVGRFRAVDPVRFPRTVRVICRTRRGLEVGEVLAEETESVAGECDGSLLRRVTVEDDLILARLEQNREEAFEACIRKLNEKSLEASLMDVEHLFDGQSIYFYFFGEVTPGVETITSDLAEAYEAKVQFRKFTENVIAGCGPDCGTENAENGCGTACSSCAVAGACATSK